MFLYKILFVAVLALLSSCQKKPGLSLAADSLSTLAQPPMGSNIYNDELKKELDLIDKNLELHEDERLWLRGRLLFLRRRFAESAMILSQVLKNKPNFFQARNFRARALFFLGNPDLAIKELELILSSKPDEESKLDALYLVGAIIFESEDADKNKILLAQNAWGSYLASKSATDQNIRKEIALGLVEFKKRLEPKKEEHSANNYSQAKKAVFIAFQKEELLLALRLSSDSLEKGYDKEIALIKARTLIKMGQIEGALAEFFKLNEAYPQFAQGFHYLGMAYMLKGEPKKAVLAWQRTLNLDENYGKMHNLEKRIAVAKSLEEPVKIESH